MLPLKGPSGDSATGRFREHRVPDGEMEIDLFRDDGLVHDVVSSIAVADGVMWVGTYFGLSRYDGRRWRSYCQTDSGLAGDFINAVCADGPVVWVATDSGLSRFDSRDWTPLRRDESRVQGESFTAVRSRPRSPAQPRSRPVTRWSMWPRSGGSPR